MGLDPAGVQMIAEGVAAYVSDLNKADGATTSFYKTLGASDKPAGAFQQVITGALRQVGAALIEFAAQGAKAIGGFVKDSVSLAGDFESGMLNFQAVAGKEVDTKGLEDFRDLFIQLGKELPVSTSEVQLAATEMVKGGIDPATIAAGGLRQNIQFAAAAMDGDLVKAAEISSKVMGGWTAMTDSAADKSAFLTHATDLLAKAANASSTDVEGLSLGIFNAQGIAKTAGVSFDDLTTTLAELAPRFASSSEAGTSLKNLISRLQPTTKPAIAAMEGLGLITESGKNKFYDASGAFVGFQQASQLLQTSLKGLTKQQQASILQTIFGNDAMSAASALAELGASGYSSMADALQNANGVLDAAALKQQGFDTALDNAKGSVEALQITIGSALLPILNDLLTNYIAPGVNAVTSFAEAFIKMVPAIIASDDPIQTFLNALKVAAPGLLDIITQIESAKDAFVAFVTPIQATVIPIMQQLATFIGGNLTPILFGIATAITAAVVPALAAATVAFVSAAAPVVALVAAGALLYSAWTEDFLGIRTTVTSWWTGTLEPIFEQVYEWLAKEIPVAVATMSVYWTDTLLPAIKKVGEFLDGVIFPILGDLANVWIALASKEISALSALWTGVLWPALKIVGDFITGTLVPIFKGLFEVEWAIAMKAGEALAGLWQKVIQPALKSVGDYITTTVLPAFQSIGNYLTVTFGPILNDAEKWLSDVTGGFAGVTGGVKEVVTWLENLATSISKLKLPDWLTPGSPTPFETGLVGIASALQNVKPGLSAMQQGLSEISTQITETFINSDMIDAFTALGEDVMAGFGKGMKSATRGILNLINSTADTVEGAFQDAFAAHSPAERMVPVGQNIISGMIQGLLDGWPALTDQIGTIADSLVSQMESIGDRMQSAIAGGFSATSTIDRQLVKNMQSLTSVSEGFYRTATENALKNAQQVANAYADPTIGAKFFKMRSDQIFEFQKLQQQIDSETDAAKKQQLQQQQTLITKAQEAEQAAFDAQYSRTGGAAADLVNQIHDLLASISNINQDTNFDTDQLSIVNALWDVFSQLSGAQHRAGGGAVSANQPYMVGEQGPELFFPKAAGRIMDNLASRQWQAMSAGSMAQAGNVTNTTHGATINMPIYTNQSPSVLQASMAIAGASLL